MSRHFKDKKVFGRSQRGFTKGKWCQTNLIVFYDEMSGSVEKERKVDIVYFDFSHTFDMNTHPCVIPGGTLKRYGFDRWTMNWMWNWLNCWAHSIMISGTESYWWPAINHPQGWHWGQRYWTFLFMTQIIEGSALSANLWIMLQSGRVVSVTVVTYEGYPTCRCVKVMTVGFAEFHNTQGLRSWFSVNFFITYYC